MRAHLSADGQTVTLTGPRWSEAFPLSDLAAKQRLYRSLWERGSAVKGEPGPWARHYTPTLAALLSIAKQVAS